MANIKHHKYPIDMIYEPQDLIVRFADANNGTILELGRYKGREVGEFYNWAYCEGPGSAWSTYKRVMDLSEIY